MLKKSSKSTLPSTPPSKSMTLSSSAATTAKSSSIQKDSSNSSPKSMARSDPSPTIPSNPHITLPIFLGNLSSPSTPMISQKLSLSMNTKASPYKDPTQ